VYGQQHLDRLALLDELKAEGLNLQAISFLLGGGENVDNEELRGLKRAILDSWGRSDPEELSLKDLRKQLRLSDEELTGYAQRAMELGLLGPAEEEDTVRVLLPDILTAGRELMEMGVGFDRALDVLEDIREHAGAVADSYVDMFDEAVLAPWDARGRPDDEWREVREAVERLRPIAGDALLAVFNQLIEQAITERLSSASPE
jgi:DNA-binding transcriptional MerR regulator